MNPRGLDRHHFVQAVEGQYESARMLRKVARRAHELAGRASVRRKRGSGVNEEPHRSWMKVSSD